jgi:dihydrofolate reductase
MRELHLKMSMSLDGYVADPDGGLQWVFGSDQEAKAWVVDYIADAGLHIMGSRTFADMCAWWPTATDQFAPPMNRIPKAVFSRRGAEVLKSADTTRALESARARAADTQSVELQPGAESWAEAYVASGDLAEEIARLKAQDGGPILAHGGVRFVRSLIAQGLVDEIALVVMPVALGQGQSIFADLAQPLPLKLERAKVFPGGAVAKVFRPA